MSDLGSLTSINNLIAQGKSGEDGDMPKGRKKRKEIKREMTCIVCPRNCEGLITVNYRGYECDKGFKYAMSELISPQRVLTATLPTEESRERLLPVRTDKEIEKNKIMEMIQVLRSKRVKPPIKMGEVLIPNVLDTGANIISCADLLE